jgi:hypothetical protein
MAMLVMRNMITNGKMPSMISRIRLTVGEPSNIA